MERKLMIRIAPITDIPLGQGRLFIVRGEEIAVFRSRFGEVFAIENRCPHRQGPLVEGMIGSGKVVCPLHGHKFDLVTGQGSETNECIRTFKAWIEHEYVVIDWLPMSQKKEVECC